MREMAEPAQTTALLPDVALYGPLPLPGTELTVRGVPAATLSASQYGELVELLRAAFNGGPGWFDLPVAPVDHLRWKFGDNPGNALAILIEEQERLAGFSGRWYRDWMVQGIRRVVSSSGESALAERYQGQGAGSARSDLTRSWDAAEFSFSFGSHPSTLNRRSRTGSQSLGREMDTLIRVLDVARFVRDRGPERTGTSRTRITLEQRGGRKPRPWPLRWAAWQRRILRDRLQQRMPRIPAPRGQLRTVTQFDSRVDALFARVSPAFEMIQVRERDFLNWRYADPRAGGFTIRLFEDGDELLGYAVTRATSGQSDLADLLAPPERLDVVAALLRDSLDVARQARSTAVRTWMMQGHPYHGLLRSLGFIPGRGVVVPAFRTMAMPPGTLDFLQQPDVRIHLMPGDSDHV